MSERRAVLVVTRGAAGKETSAERFEVAYAPGQSVLDGLLKLRATVDPTLAIRHSCISANSCKECMILVDGTATYACTTKLEPREMRLEPLPNKAHLRDLVTEIAPPDERLDRVLADRRTGED